MSPWPIQPMLILALLVVHQLSVSAASPTVSSYEGSGDIDHTEPWGSMTTTDDQDPGTPEAVESAGWTNTGNESSVWNLGMGTHNESDGGVLDPSNDTEQWLPVSYSHGNDTSWWDYVTSSMQQANDTGWWNHVTSSMQQSNDTGWGDHVTSSTNGTGWWDHVTSSMNNTGWWNHVTSSMQQSNDTGWWDHVTSSTNDTGWWNHVTSSMQQTNDTGWGNDVTHSYSGNNSVWTNDTGNAGWWNPMTSSYNDSGATHQVNDTGQWTYVTHAYNGSDSGANAADNATDSWIYVTLHANETDNYEANADNGSHVEPTRADYPQQWTMVTTSSFDSSTGNIQATTAEAIANDVTTNDVPVNDVTTDHAAGTLEPEETLTCYVCEGQDCLSFDDTTTEICLSTNGACWMSYNVFSETMSLGCETSVVGVNQCGDYPAGVFANVSYCEHCCPTSNCTTSDIVRRAAEECLYLTSSCDVIRSYLTPIIFACVNFYILFARPYY